MGISQMRMKLSRIIENSLWQELFVLVFSFMLFTLNDWVLIGSWHSVWKALCYFLILYAHAQVNRFFLLPILFQKYKPLVYVLLSIFLAVVFSVFLYEISTKWLYKDCFLFKSERQKSYIFQLATLVASFICVIGPILLLKFYREEKQKSREVLLFKETQLNSLRDQLNPHFLFNTFNTLYGISLEYPERTPELIMKVSQLMRYQLESSSKSEVTLEDEIDFIDSYIQLEKERIGYRCDIRYEAQTEAAGAYKIAPMLLITFVENAFKHGTCAIENCYVHIEVKVEDAKLKLNIVNSIPVKKPKVVSTKIGLKNTIERIEILYPGKHQLTVDAQESTYSVNLEIELL